jgi:hypothetical protein
MGPLRRALRSQTALCAGASPGVRPASCPPRLQPSAETASLALRTGDAKVCGGNVGRARRLLAALRRAGNRRLGITRRTNGRLHMLGTRVSSRRSTLAR